MIAALLRQELPQRLKLGGKGIDTEGIEDRMWGLMLMCWNYTPQHRPSSEKLRNLIAAFCYKNSQPGLPIEGESSIALWEAMRDESTMDVDYDQVEKILLWVSTPNPLVMLGLHNNFCIPILGQASDHL